MHVCVTKILKYALMTHHTHRQTDTHSTHSHTDTHTHTHTHHSALAFKMFKIQ